MTTYKNIRVKKPNGGFRTQRVQVMASGKYKFVKNKGRSTKARRRSVRAAPKARRRTYVARRKRRGGGRKGIRVAAGAGIIAGLYMMGKSVYKAPADQRAAQVVLSLTGYNMITQRWEWQRADFTIPAIAGCGLSMVASKVGLNRYTPKGINI